MGVVVVTPYTDEDIEDLRKQVEKRSCKKLEKFTDSGRLQWQERFRPFPTAIPTLLMSYAHAIFLTGSLFEFEPEEFWSFSWTHCYRIKYRHGSRFINGVSLRAEDFQEHQLIGWRFRRAWFPIEITMESRIYDYHLGSFFKKIVSSTQ